MIMHYDVTHAHDIGDYDGIGLCNLVPRVLVRWVRVEHYDHFSHLTSCAVHILSVTSLFVLSFTLSTASLQLRFQFLFNRGFVHFSVALLKYSKPWPFQSGPVRNVVLQKKVNQPVQRVSSTESVRATPLGKKSFPDKT